MTAEAEYLLARRGSAGAVRNFVADLAAGRFQVECLLREEYPLVLSLMDRYAALDPGLADLST
ncbi:MAG: hypothetical protein ACRDHY_06260, partial [Anaerolineales bacterium]